MLYAAYVKERLGKDVYSTDDGFAVYEIGQNNQGAYIYIEEIYVVPEQRKRGVARSIADVIVDIAKEKGIKVVYGSVNTTANGVSESMTVLLHYGMKFSHIKNEMIYFVKHLGD